MKQVIVSIAPQIPGPIKAGTPCVVTVATDAIPEAPLSQVGIVLVGPSGSSYAVSPNAGHAVFAWTPPVPGDYQVNAWALSQAGVHVDAKSFVVHVT